jgi:hypothetical protein
MIALLARGIAGAILSAALSFAPASGVAVPHEFIPVATAEAPTALSPFSGYPVLKKICTCESGLNHFDKDGNVLRGNSNKDDIGICQINQYYHSEKPKELGLDIHTMEGNVAFAKYLYETEGTTPWNASRSCWAK